MGDWKIGPGKYSDPLVLLNASLADAELNAVDADFNDRLRAAYALNTQVLELAEAGAFDELPPEERAEAIRVLDEQIAQYETLIAG